MNAKTSPPPPPPSSFRSNVPSSGIESSSPALNSKSKRQSMNLASSSASAGPRPLHLALGSVVSASAATSSPSPSTPSLDIRTPNEANEASFIEASTSNRDSMQSATSSRGQSPLPRSPTVASLRKDSASRKRSSISYIASSPNSPSYLQTNRHDVLDGPGSALSPLGMGSGHGRTSSLGRRGSRTPRSATFAERASTGSLLTHSDANMANAMAHLKERPPLTLNEKHADLLHFIAQKESKCLELRSQLAVHEAELVQLKRKWEKIVNRGFEKALSPNTASSSTFSTSPASALSAGPSESISISPGNSSGGYFPTLNSANSNANATVVLEGIKESVQGMSRFIAAGLGSIAQVNAPPDSAAHPNASVSAHANAPLPLRLGAVSQRRAHDSGHGQTESQSSSSTMMSAASNRSSSSFLSASTASSATSAASSSSMTDSTTKHSTSDADAESEFGEFTDGSSAVASTRRRSATLTEHLMVQDTGATPMMSPNPHFERRKLRANDASSSSSLSFSSNANTSSGGGSILLSDSQQEADSSSNDNFDWDDAWDEPMSEVQMNDHFESAIPRTPTKNTSSTATSASAYVPTTAMEDHGLEDAEASAGAKGSLSPMPAIPGLAAMGMGVSTPTTQQMSSWVGTVGKKWGEIKGSPAFTKNQKRASVLLSDIQQTFVSSLVSPNSTSDSAASFSNSSYPTPTTPSSYASLSSNASHTNTPATRSSKTSVSPNASSIPAQRPAKKQGISLIDDSDDIEFGESGQDDNKTMRLPLAARMMSTSVMVPDSVSRVSEVSKTAAVDAKDTDEDEWNW